MLIAVLSLIGFMISVVIFRGIYLLRLQTHEIASDM